MSKITWNNEQSLILNKLNGNIVASASAGSGKTTVMLERIIRLIDNHVPIERMLILAYNTSIAVEIKAKLIKELEGLIATGGDKVSLYAQQLDNIDRAAISTIDSYCSSLIREYFHLLNIDANFKIMGEMEGKSVLNNVMAKKLADEKADKNSLIYQLITIFGDQKNLESSIIEYCNFLSVVPNRDKWVEEIALCNFTKDKNSSALTNELLKYISKRGVFIARVLDEAVVALNDNPRRQEDIKYISVMLEKLSNSKTVEELNRNFKMIEYPVKKEKLIKNETVLNLDEYLRAHALGKDFYTTVKSLIVKDNGADNVTLKYMQYFLEVANDISKNYTAKKASLGSFDFSDLTYWAIKLLDIDGVAEEISRRYDSVCVDEFQDDNYCQDYLISKIANDNLFVVGDVKQSIYKFRNAEPTILQTRFANAKSSGGNNIAVRLNENYRSDYRVLDFVNRIFNRILSEDCGGINYADEEQLREGTKYLVKDEKEIAEINIFCGKQEKEKTAYDFNTDIYDISKANRGKGISPTVIAEANYIADKIISLVETEQIYDAKVREFRAVNYEDITILVKSRNTRVTNILNIISSRGIPIDDKSLKKEEVDSNIKYINSLLRVIDNDMQDLALAIALRGSFGKMSYDDLAQIRGKHPSEPTFYKACLKARGYNFALDNFYSSIEQLRVMSATKSIYELASEMVYRYGIWESLGYQDDADIARHNVSQFLDKLKSNDLSLSQYVKALDSGDDSDYMAYSNIGNTSKVQTATIHGSKGLEYPIVFLIDCGDKLVKSLNRSTLKYNVNYGIIADNFNDNNMLKSESSSKVYYKFVNSEENQAEAMRLLYVALTRARNMVFVSGTLEKYKEVLSPYDATNFLSWIIYVASCDSRIKGCLKVHDCQAAIADKQEEVEKIATIDKSIRPPSQFVDYVNYSYPWENLKDLSIKYTVTEINQKDIYEDEIKQEYAPSSEAQVIEPKRGTNYHKILEYIDYSANDASKVESQLNELLAQGVIKREDLEGIDYQEIAKILDNDIMRYAAENKHLREQKFMLYASASEIFGKNYGEEEILIQGAIDLVILGDKVYLVDFKKTNKSKEKIVKTYSKQIELYTRAIEEALGVKVDRKVILVIGDGRIIEF